MSKNVNLNEPSSHSQNGRILQYLREGETITSLESLMLFRCFRCASRINDLRNDLRHPIKDVTIEVESIDEVTQEPVTKRVSAYYIPESFAERHGIENEADIENAVKLHATRKAQRAFKEYYGE